MQIIQELAQLKTLEPKRKLIFFALLLTLFGAGFGLGTFFARPQRQPKLSFPLQPSVPPKRVSQPVIVALQKENEFWTLRFDPAGNQVLGVEVELVYEPATILLPEITKGEVFNQYPILKAHEGRINLLAINLSDNLETEAATQAGVLMQMPVVSGLTNLKLIKDKTLVIDTNGQSLPIKFE